MRLALTLAAALALPLAALAQGTQTAVSSTTEAEPLPKMSWSFEGPFGTFDRASEQRGLQVWQAVCNNCHSMKEAYYRNLQGIGLTAAQVRAFASSVDVSVGTDDSGEPEKPRPALPADHFKSPYANDKAARGANGGALPPDHSLIEKAREGGATYLYALLTGYRDAPPNVKVGAGQYYNIYFEGRQIGMPPPLTEDYAKGVTFADGTTPTVDEMARDVSTFLTYMANPDMEQRKRMGVRIVLFLAGMTVVTYAVKRKIWANIH